MLTRTLISKRFGTSHVLLGVDFCTAAEIWSLESDHRKVNAGPEGGGGDAVRGERLAEGCGLQFWVPSVPSACGVVGAWLAGLEWDKKTSLSQSVDISAGRDTAADAWTLTFLCSKVFSVFSSAERYLIDDIIQGTASGTRRCPRALSPVGRPHNANQTRASVIEEFNSEASSAAKSSRPSSHTVSPIVSRKEPVQTRPRQASPERGGPKRGFQGSEMSHGF
uniref:Uncharacterized protein n=1 Tax=Knipowitschia caucasica TaxID=637954 RepID=A0AAV2JLG1_KNICA